MGSPRECTRILGLESFRVERVEWEGDTPDASVCVWIERRGIRRTHAASALRLSNCAHFRPCQRPVIIVIRRRFRDGLSPFVFRLALWIVGVYCIVQNAPLRKAAPLRELAQPCDRLNRHANREPGILAQFLAWLQPGWVPALSAPRLAFCARAPHASLFHFP